MIFNLYFFEPVSSYHVDLNRQKLLLESVSKRREVDELSKKHKDLVEEMERFHVQEPDFVFG